MAEVSSRSGIVAIGRNEGDRLRRCLESVVGKASAVVYVDSGSDDGSVSLAQRYGATVVELDTDTPFSAARARNAGLEALKGINPDLHYVQFLDGDCELDEHWLATATEALDRDRELAVVCGRRREIYPSATMYNRLCDLEWNTAVGEAAACGGDALMRVSALDAVGGFDPSVVAGEEPELCFRLRRAGWRIRRIGADMTYHDAAMSRFSQWWKRAKRAGHAAAQAMAMHGRSAERYGVGTSASIWLWAIGIPVITALSCLLVGWFGLVLLLVYPAQVGKIAWRQRRSRGWDWWDCWLYAVTCVLGKFAQCQGHCRFWWNWLRGRSPKLIEYKGQTEAHG